MQEARVGIFEDDEDWREIYADELKDAGHTLVAEATSMEEARELIEGLEADALDVALVDGNLTKGTHSGEDGTEISRLLHEKFGEQIVVIGVSGDGEVPGADYNVPKIAFEEFAPLVEGL